MASVPLEEPHKAQVGTLIVRGRPGSQEVLLITSRETGRWIISKGWPMKGKQDHAAAAQVHDAFPSTTIDTDIEIVDQPVNQRFTASEPRRGRGGLHQR